MQGKKGGEERTKESKWSSFFTQANVRKRKPIGTFDKLRYHCNEIPSINFFFLRIFIDNRKKKGRMIGLDVFKLGLSDWKHFNSKVFVPVIYWLNRRVHKFHIRNSFQVRRGIGCPKYFRWLLRLLFHRVVRELHEWKKNWMVWVIIYVEKTVQRNIGQDITHSQKKKWNWKIKSSSSSFIIIGF